MVALGLGWRCKVVPGDERGAAWRCAARRPSTGTSGRQLKDAAAARPSHRTWGGVGEAGRGPGGERVDSVSRAAPASACRAAGLPSEYRPVAPGPARQTHNCSCFTLRPGRYTRRAPPLSGRTAGRSHTCTERGSAAQRSSAATAATAARPQRNESRHAALYIPGFLPARCPAGAKAARSRPHRPCGPRLPQCKTVTNLSKDH